MLDIKLSIIIPVYNEINTFLKILELVRIEPHNKEIIIVDDGSTDGTKEIIQQINEPNIKIIFHEKNMGKGACIKTAQEHVTGNIVIIQDADLEYYPDEYGALIEKIIQNKADVVFGTRFLGIHRVFYFYHFLGNGILNLAANMLLNTNLSDLMTGYKAFKVDIFKKLSLESKGFGIEPEITAEIFKKRYKVYEVPISYDGRAYEEGKKIKLSDFFVCIYWLIKTSLKRVDVGQDTLLRMKIMKNYNKQMFLKFKNYLGKKILEVGAGIGSITEFLSTQKKPLLISEINDERLQHLNSRFSANPHIKIIKNNITEMDESLIKEDVDTVVCINIIEHLKNDEEALSNINKYIVKNGRVIIVVPAHKFLFSNLDKELGHFRRYTKKSIKEKLEKTGFVVEKTEYINSLAAVGWLLSFRIFRQKSMSKFIIRIYDKFIPLIFRAENIVNPFFGLSVFIVGRKARNII